MRAIKEKLVLIGNGIAALRTAEELLKLDGAERYQIAMFGEEPHSGYNRIMLSPVLAGEQDFAEITLKPRQWYEDNAISLHTGDPVIKIDRVRRKVITALGKTQGYDRLIIATGSSPFILPVPGANLEGVLGFRDILDVEKMLEIAKSQKNAVVIGGGLLGLEAAYGLLKRGMNVTVVHHRKTLMGNQLDSRAAELLQSSLGDKGIRFVMEKSTAEILGTERVTGLRFTDGDELAADMVVMTAGTRPNMKLAKNAGIYCEQGIVVSDTMQTFDPRVYAVGECVQHRGTCYGLVAPVFEQAKVCANHLASLGYSQYVGTMTSTRLKVTGIELFSVGNFLGDQDSENLIYSDPGLGIYKKLVIKENKVDGAVLFGDTTDGNWYFELMQNETDISEIRDNLLFGRAYVGEFEQSGKALVSV